MYLAPRMLYAWYAMPCSAQIRRTLPTTQCGANVDSLSAPFNTAHAHYQLMLTMYSPRSADVNTELIATGSIEGSVSVYPLEVYHYMYNYMYISYIPLSLGAMDPSSSILGTTQSVMTSQPSSIESMLTRE